MVAICPVHMSTKLKVEVLWQLGGGSGGSLAQKPADAEEGKRARLFVKTTVRGVFTGCLTTGPRRGIVKHTTSRRRKEKQLFTLF